MNRPVEWTADELLRHAGFLKRLALTLVRDEHESEDLVQQAFSLALASPPEATPGSNRSGGPRAWLARVVRTRAANLLRDRARRNVREAIAARPETDPDSNGVEGDLELHERVLAAVRALREPYRTAIYLRYFRERSVEAIAADQGVPTSTVDTRLGRGRALLKEALTREFGDRRTWVTALLPMTGAASPGAPAAGSLAGAHGVPASASVPLSIGTWIVAMKLEIALAVAGSALAIAAWTWSGPSGPAPRVLERSSASGVPTLVASDALALEPAPRAPERAAVAVPGEPAAPVAPARETAEPPVAGPRSVAVHGRALDHRGLPLANAHLRFHPGEDSPAPAAPVTTSDSLGRFELAGLLGGGQVRVDEPDLVTVLTGSCEGDGTDPEIVVVAAPLHRLEVRVVDEGGAPVADAAVELSLPEDFRSRLEYNLDRCSDVVLRVPTDERGVAQLERAPLVVGSRILATREGYRPAVSSVDAGSAAAGSGGERLTLVLHHLAGEPEILRGSVVDEYGNGLAGVPVALGRSGTHSGADGTFFLDVEKAMQFHVWHGEPGAEHDLVAARPGYLPAVLRPELDVLDGHPVWPDPIVLRPIERPLRITGRVVDQLGEGLGGYTVFLKEAHLFLGGRTLEGLLAGQQEHFLFSTRSDAEGRFELGGLLDQDYDISAVEDASLLRGDVDDVAAGSEDVVIRVDTSRVWRRVRGRVVDRAGNPIAGASVAPYVYTQRARGAEGDMSTSADRPAVTTDEEGGFVLRDLPCHALLSVRHPEIMYVDDVAPTRPEHASACDEQTLEDVTIVASMRLRFQVLLDDPTSADALRVVDADGAALDLYTQTANAYVIRSDNDELTNGRSRHLFVEEGAAQLLLLRAGLEVRRIDLALQPREETRLQL